MKTTYQLTLVFFLLLTLSCKKKEPIPTINVQSVKSPISDDLYAVHFPTTQVGYAAGNNNVIIKTTDGGNTWTQLPPVYTSIYESITGVYFINNDTGIVVFQEEYFNNLVQITYNGGTSFFNVDTNYTSTGTTIYNTYTQRYPNQYSFYFNSNYGFQSGQQFITKGFVVQNTYGLSNDVLVVDYSLYGLYFTDQNNGYVVGDNTIASTSNGGSSWTWLRSQHGTNIPYLLYGVYCFNTGSGIAVGSGGSIVKFSK